MPLIQCHKGNRKVLSMFVLLAGLVLLPKLRAQDCISLAYADHLFEEREYYRAISEYYRYLYFKAQTFADSSYCLRQIARCYYFGEDYEGLTSFVESWRPRLSTPSGLVDDLNQYAGLGYLKMGFQMSAKLCFEQSPDSLKSLFLVGVAQLYMYDWNAANKGFALFSNVSDETISVASRELSLLAQKGKCLKMKSPLVAGVLSGILPGAGYAYSGFYQTALSSLVLNGLFLMSSYELNRKGLKYTGGTATMISFGWYIGNIYGSVTSAMRHNESKRKAFVEESLQRYKPLIE